MIVRFFRICLSLTLCAMVAGTALAADADKVTFRVIYNNQGYGQPGGLIEGSPGVFYSIAGSGPSVAFSVTTQGSRTILVSFPTGLFQSLLVSAPNGRFYSSIYSGGLTSVFSVTSAANSGRTYAGQTFVPSLVQNLPDGTLLGVGTGGADGLWQLIRCGLEGAVTSIAQLPSGERLDNAIYASDGNYYGVAQGPEASSTASYVFRATPSGTTTTLYSFPAETFTQISSTPLLQGNDGNLYGGTDTGGAHGTGMIYKLTLDGQFTLLHSFGKGKYPAGPTTLIEASDGNLYGDAHSYASAGQLFRITKSGQYTVLYEMSGSTGSCPCWLVQGSDGIIYGTAAEGGSSDDGAVFALDAGLPIPKPQAQQFQPQSGAVGTQVRIWGYNLLSSTVQFNGVPATAVSNSGSNYVWATVPTGAATGPITVSTPGGTVTTEASFTVQ